MTFFQTPPALGNQYTDDRFLQSYLRRVLPEPMLRAIEPELSDLGERSGGDLYASLLAGHADEPTLAQWDAWGKRVDRIELTRHWREMAKIAAEKGVVATAYERRNGEHSRIHQFALAYLFDGSSGVYTCPLAMTDGATKTLLSLGNQALIDRAVPRLTSRNPNDAWTSGQWMTERTGGSDVAIAESVARPRRRVRSVPPLRNQVVLSATTSQMALTLARPEGNGAGGGGLALFYVEMRDADGVPNGIEVNRLKDKLGTRMVPTAELTLNGALATPVRGLTDGIRQITPMLTVTRTWNAVCSVSSMRRGLALSRDYAKKRVAFGAPLADKPLHVDTLAGLEAEYQGAFLLTFRVVELLGKEEAGTLQEHEARLLRILTPIMKLTTARQTVAAASEVVEGFGGAGYVEDTGLPRILRDAQVLSIWEGTTNVLSLDVFRALGKSGSVEPILDEVRARVHASDDPVGRAALDATLHAGAWLEAARGRGQAAVEAGARRFALTLGRAVELALLVDHGAWAKRALQDGRAAAAARRFARNGVDLIEDEDDLAGRRRARERVDGVRVRGARVSARGARVRARGARVRARRARVWARRARVSARGALVRARGARVRARGALVRARGARVSARGARVGARGARVRARGARVRARGARVSARGALVRARGARVRARGARVCARRALVRASRARVRAAGGDPWERGDTCLERTGACP